MVDAVVNYLSMTVENTQASATLALTDNALNFRNVTKRSTKPLESGSARTYDLNFGTVDGGLAEDVENDVVPFEYNTADFDMNNEITLVDHVNLTGGVPLFFDLMPITTSGTLHKFDMVVSSTDFATPACDVLVKRVKIDEVASGISNPFITQEINAIDRFFGMASNPVSRAGQIIAYDFVLLYLAA